MIALLPAFGKFSGNCLQIWEKVAPTLAIGAASATALPTSGLALTAAFGAAGVAVAELVMHLRGEKAAASQDEILSAIWEELKSKPSIDNFTNEDANRLNVLKDLLESRTDPANPKVGREHRPLVYLAFHNPSLREALLTFFTRAARSDIDFSGDIESAILASEERHNQALLEEIENLPKAVRAAFIDDITDIKTTLANVHSKVAHIGRTITRMAVRIGEDPDTSDLGEEILQAYATKLMEWYQIPEILSVKRSLDSKVFSLADIFVEPSLRKLPKVDPRILEIPTEHLTARDFRQLSRGSPGWSQQIDEERRTFFQQVPEEAFSGLNRWRTKGQILFAGAGGGKSALMRFLALRWADAWLNKESRPHAGPVPVLIELRRYASARSRDHTLSLMRFIATSQDLPSNIPETAVKTALNKEEAFLLLDGLDEVGEPRLRDKVVHQITSHLALGHRCLITSRVFGFERALWEGRKDVTAFHVLSFSDRQRDEFIGKAHRMVAPEPHRQSHLGSRLFDRLDGMPHYRDFADNPLLLTLLILVNVNDGSVETRKDLYEQAAKLLLDTWESDRLGSDVSPLPAGVEALRHSSKESILAHLAWEQLKVAKDQVSNVFSLAAIQQAIRGALVGLTRTSVEYYVEELPEILRKRHYVLCSLGGDFYGFVHRSFLDYYGCLRLHQLVLNEELRTDDIFEQYIREHHTHESWQELLRLYFSFIDSSKAERFIKSLLLIEESPLESPALLLAAEGWQEIKQSARPLQSGEGIAKQVHGILQTDRIRHSPSFALATSKTDPLPRLVRALVRLDLNLCCPLKRWRTLEAWRGSHGGPLLTAIEELSHHLNQNEDFRRDLLAILGGGSCDRLVKIQAIKLLEKCFGKDPGLLEALKAILRNLHSTTDLRSQAISTLDNLFSEHSERVSRLKDIFGPPSQTRIETSSLRDRVHPES